MPFIYMRKNMFMARRKTPLKALYIYQLKNVTKPTAIHGLHS